MKTLRIAMIVLVAAACGEGITDINDDPNAPTDVSAQLLFPQAIRGAVENTWGRMLLAHTSIWSQHTVQIQYPDEERGNVRPSTIQGFWDSYYAGALKDIDVVIDKAREAGDANQEAVGLIWRAWIFHQVTDLWGDAPYSEALQAEDGMTTPAYDTQQAIYTDLLQSLTDAEAMLDPAGSTFGGGDILYGDDVESWRRFANSLRMRLAMRLSEVDATTAESQFTAALAAGGFEDNDDNAMLRWPGAPHQQLLFENWQGRDDDGVSATMIDSLTSLNDPRLELYAEPATADGAYRGLGNNIATPDSSLAWYSRIGNFWRADGASTPTAIMTYAEVLFLRAEAAVRGWTTEDPATLYEEGIRANMDQYDDWSPANGPTDAEIDAYVAQPVIQYNPATGMEQIQLQKWLSLYLQGSEAWANQRRTDLPALVAGPDLQISRIPVRFYYPGGEQSLNSASLNEAVSRQGGGLDLVMPVWWDMN